MDFTSTADIDTGNAERVLSEARFEVDRDASGRSIHITVSVYSKVGDDFYHRANTLARDLMNEYGRPPCGMPEEARSYEGQDEQPWTPVAEDGK